MIRSLQGTREWWKATPDWLQRLTNAGFRGQIQATSQAVKRRLVLNGPSPQLDIKSEEAQLIERKYSSTSDCNIDESEDVLESWRDRELEIVTFGTTPSPNSSFKCNSPFLRQKLKLSKLHGIPVLDENSWSRRPSGKLKNVWNSKECWDKGTTEKQDLECDP